MNVQKKNKIKHTCKEMNNTHLFEIILVYHMVMHNLIKTDQT